MTSLRETRQYLPISLSKAADQQVGEADEVPMVARQPLCPPANIEVPPISFGVADLGARRLRQTPIDTAAASTHAIGGIDLFTVRNATLHSGIGLVTCGDYFFTDFLYHAHTHRLPGWGSDCGFATDGAYLLPSAIQQIKVERAFHLLAGNTDNYFHWMVDIVGRFDSALSSGYPGMVPPLLLVPELDSAYKWESLELLRKERQSVIQCGDAAVIAVERLIIMPDLSGAGFFPHPALLRPFAEMRSRVNPNPMAPHRRIFISRKDAKQRRLTNEDDIIKIAEEAAFEVIRLSDLTVREQICLFSEASHIIAPHGAGLVNILFCQPGASLLELHMDSYTQWSFRRFAGAMQMVYGCLIGTAIQAWDDTTWPHNSEWTLDIADLRAVLSAGVFVNT